MATEGAGQTNGYGTRYGASEMPPQLGATNTNGSTESATPSKDEIGWYFVEQYYTTLSKNPEKLHLFYAKRSQFVSGLEAEKAPVCVGQRAIADRIKVLSVQQAKVRVTNVDSQESGRDIVAQVIGEMSIKGLPHRKFVQTFVLAEQPNGYFVLNDIFRYIADEEEDEVEENPTEASTEAESHTLPSTNEVAHQDEEVEILDKKLEETVAEPEIEPAAIAAIGNKDVAEPQPVDATAKEVTEDKSASPSPEEAVQAVEDEEEEEKITEEKPKDPEPTPAPASPVKSVANPVSESATESAASSKPAAPKTWASMLAGNKANIAVPRAPAQAPSQSKTSSKSIPTAAPEAISAPNAVATVAGLTEDSQAPPSPGGWQTAGQENNRKQHKQQPGTLGGQIETASAYIKNVTEKVDAAILKQTLSKFGKLAYFDVSRPKNCAFVEFDSQSAFQAAVSANPHIINGIEVIVAERHRAGNGFPRGGGIRGGRGNMENRTNSQGGRGGFNKDSRGNFANRGGRGGAPAQRGRGGANSPQAA